MTNTTDIIESLFETITPPQLGPARRPEAIPLNEIENKMAKVLANAKLLESDAQKVRCACLLWHDHLEESHEISQDLHDADGCFLHAIMHRREPDYPNSKYWFNRTEDHPAYSGIHECVVAISDNFDLFKKTATWNSLEMVDAVSRAIPNTEEYSLLQQIQQIEFKVLVRRFSQ